MTDDWGKSGFRWLARYSQYCVTVVGGADPARVLAGFGAVAEDAVLGGPREAASMTAERHGYRPVVRVVPAGGWVVAVEQFSLEGVRPEVLVRLSTLGRAVAVGVSGDGMRWLGYADDGGWVDRVETASAGAPGDPGWGRLVRMAERASVPLDEWVAEDLPASSMRFLTAVCGIAIDDELIGTTGPIGLALPVLPPVAPPSARVAAILRSVPAGALADVAARHLRDFLVDAGVDDQELLAAVSAGTAPEVSDESPVGVALRELVADALLATGAAADPNGPHLLPPERATALHQRADAGHAAHALLAGGPEAAITSMLQRRRSPAGWRDRLLDELGVTGAADEGRRARSIPVDPDRLRPPGIVAPRSRAVRHPGALPGPRPDEG